MGRVKGLSFGMQSKLSYHLQIDSYKIFYLYLRVTTKQTLVLNIKEKEKVIKTYH